jgi:hypothetical protein
MVVLQIDYWKDQAGLPAEQRTYIDLLNIKDERAIPEEES